MGGAVQSSLKRWVPLGKEDEGSRDPGILLERLLHGSKASVSVDEVARLYAAGNDCIVGDRFPEDLLVFSQLLGLVQKADSVSVDRHEVLALVHKMNSPEKLMKSLFALVTQEPFEMDLLKSCKEYALTQFIDEMLASRCRIIDFMNAVIQLVHQASGELASFPRWTSSASFLCRLGFAQSSLELFKYINGTRTASGTSLFADFLLSSSFDGFEGDFEDMVTRMMIQFGFWLENKKLYELALMWLDSFDINILSTTSVVCTDLLSCLAYVRGVLCLVLERPQALELLLEASLAFPTEKADSPLLRFITGGESWDRLVCLKHCIDLASTHHRQELVRDFCGEALQLLEKASELSLLDLHISEESMHLQLALDVSLRYFEVLLELEEPLAAFSAISSVPSVFEKPHSCVDRLVDFLITHQEHRPLLAQLPWGQWWPSVCSFLESKGCHRILFSLQCSRADYKSATTTAYNLAINNQNLEEARLLLILGKQTLLLSQDDAWFVSNGQIITPNDMETAIILFEVKQFVLERVPDAALDPESLQNHLFAYGAYKLAFKLVKALSLPLDPVFRELAQELVYHQQTKNSPVEALQWIHLWLEGTECVRLDPAAAIGKIIQQCLASEGSSHYFTLVAETILETGGQLPSWLKSDLMLVDSSALVRLLLKHGHNDESIECGVETILQQTRALFERPSKYYNCITASALDSLLSQSNLVQREALDRAWQGYLEASQRAS